MAYNIIGKKQLPWAPDTPLVIGESQIRVVVYRGIDKKDVEEAFEPDEYANCDYRYVKYSDALSYLDNHIARDILHRITDRLESTRSIILTHLGAG